MKGRKRNHDKIETKKIPQKEDLELISEVPRLIKLGHFKPEDIANYAGQCPRQGHFLINTCEILGWFDGTVLTYEGERVAKADLRIRFNLTKKAVLSSEIFQYLAKELGEGWYINPPNEQIIDSLIEAGLSRVTARRRTSSIRAWASFVQMDGWPREMHTYLSLGDERVNLVRDVNYNGCLFDVAIQNTFGSNRVLVKYCNDGGLDDSIGGLSSIDVECIEFLFIIRGIDKLKFSARLALLSREIADRAILYELLETDPTICRTTAERYLLDEPRLLNMISRTRRLAHNIALIGLPTRFDRHVFD